MRLSSAVQRRLPCAAAGSFAVSGRRVFVTSRCDSAFVRKRESESVYTCVKENTCVYLGSLMHMSGSGMYM